MPQGLSQRDALAGAGRALPRLRREPAQDDLYQKVMMSGIKSPIAGVYWFNQNVIDNVLDYTGRGNATLDTKTMTFS